ncbi:hypothetical protein QBC44DRAFT_372434 [Cladorrhinum sp. PSN332]|nr:hypothetical protein QBC44DRAFT_372434 [Cladorrhinum sp. PSN332]
MSGYSASTSAFVKQLDADNFIRFSEFSVAAYVVQDGNRVRESMDRVVVPYPRQDGYVEPLILSKYGHRVFYNCTEGPLPPPQSCMDLKQTSAYVMEYGFHGLKNMATIFWGNNISAPALNISGFYFTPKRPGSTYDPFGREWVNHVTNNYEFVHRNHTSIMFATDSGIAEPIFYGLSYILQNGRCQQISDRYHWGFSYLQTIILDILILMWTLGIFLIWLKAEINLPLPGHQEVPRGWLSLLQMADSLRTECVDSDISVTHTTDSVLKREVPKTINGGHISFDTNWGGDTGMLSLRTWIWAWCKNSPGWVVIFGANLSLFVASLVLHTLWRPVWGALISSWIASLVVFIAMFIDKAEVQWLLPVSMAPFMMLLLGVVRAV